MPPKRRLAIETLAPSVERPVSVQDFLKGLVELIKDKQPKQEDLGKTIRERMKDLTEKQLADLDDQIKSETEVPEVIRNAVRVEIETKLAELKKKKDAAIDKAKKKVKSSFNWKSLAAHTGAALAGGIAAKWVWDHTIGWMWDKAVGSKKEPGFMRKAATFLVTLGGAIALSRSVPAITGYIRKQFGLDILDDAKAMMRRGEPWKEYGLKNAYELRRAKEAHAEGDTKKLRQIFKVSGKETSDEYKKFVSDMEKRKETKTVNGITYARAEVAMENYRTNLETILIEFGVWIRHHWAEVVVGTYLATRVGLLKAVLSGAQSAGKKALEIGSMFVKWGIKHPIASILLAFGAVVATREAMKGRDSLLLPENLKELTNASGKKASIAIGPIEPALAPHIESLRKLGDKIGIMKGTLGEWTRKQLENVEEVIEGIPDAIGLTQKEVIYQENEQCIAELRTYLELRKKDAKTSTKERDRVPLLNAALKSLESFSIAFFTKMEDRNAKEKEFVEMKQKLEAAGIEIGRKRGRIVWKADGREEYVDLCVDPSVTDVKTIYERSKGLYYGESTPSHILSAALRKFRETQQQASDSCVGYIAGNFLYCVDPRNAGSYFIVPVNSAKALLDKDASTRKKGSIIVEGLVTTTAFTFSAGTLAVFKRLAIGGGPLIKSRALRIGINLTPGVSQINLIKSVRRGITDLRVFMRHGFRGRYINNVLSKAGVRPEWIRAVETTDSYKALEKIARKVGVGELPHGLEKARGVVRTHITDMLKRTRTFSIRKLRYMPSIDSTRIYDDVAGVVASKPAPPVASVAKRAPPPLKPKPQRTGAPSARRPAPSRTTGGTSHTRPARRGAAVADDVLPTGARVATKLDDPLMAAGAAVSKERVAAIFGADLAKRSSKAADAVSKIGVSPKLADALDESEQFARLLAKHLDEVDDSAKVLMRITKIADGLDDPLLLSRVCLSEAQLARVLGMSDDVTKIPASFARISDAVTKMGGIGKVSPRLLSTLDESPAFARVLLSHLDSADDPVVALRAFSQLVDAVDDPLIVGKLVTSEARLAKVLARATDGTDGMAKTVTAFSKTAKIMKVVQAAGVVADAFAIYVTVQDIVHTSALVEAAEKRGSSDEYINQLRGRYAYHAAELGVATTGIVAGGAILLGVGGTVAVPVLLATLPISAVIYGAYSNHRWEEDKTRSAKDWVAENSLVQLLVDARSYDFGERVGHFFSRSSWDGIETDLKDVNEKMIRGMVMHRTTVGVPTKVMGADGKPRDLTPKEAAQYKASAEAYVEAKVRYIMSQIKDVYYAVNSYADVRNLMRDSEDFALLAHAEKNYEQSGKKLPDGWPKKDWSMEKRARAFGLLRRKQSVRALYMESLMSMAMGKETSEKLAASNRTAIAKRIRGYLVRESQSILTKFEVRCQEQSIRDWWPDGNAVTILETYLGEGFEKILRQQTDQISDEILASIEDELSGKVKKGYHQNPIEKLGQSLKDAVQKVNDHYLSLPVNKLWDGIPEKKKTAITEERAWDSNEHVQRSYAIHNIALQRTLAQAKSALDSSSYNQVVAEVRAVQSDRKLSLLQKEKKLRDIERKISQQILERVSASTPVRVAPAVISSALGIPDGVRALVSINMRGGSSSDGEIASLLRDVFGTYPKRGSFEAMHGKTMGGSVVLYQFNDSGKGSRSVSEIHFFNGTKGRIRRRTAQISFGLTRRINRSIQYLGTTEEQISQWGERNTHMLKAGKKKTPLVGALEGVDEQMRLEKIAVQKRTEEKTRATVAARKRARLERGVFVPTEEQATSNEYQMRYEDAVVTYNTPSKIPSMSAIETGTYWHKHRNRAAFKVRYDVGRNMTFYCSNLGNIGLLTDKEEKTLSGSAQFRLKNKRLQMINYLLETPLEDDPEQSIRRLLELVPGQSYRPGKWSLYNARFYVAELHKGIVPLYRQAGNKRAFLKELRLQLLRKKQITAKTSPQILQWFKEHERLFK